jgi:hypothetical protein
MLTEASCAFDYEGRVSLRHLDIPPSFARGVLASARFGGSTSPNTAGSLGSCKFQRKRPVRFVLRLGPLSNTKMRLFRLLIESSLPPSLVARCLPPLQATWVTANGNRSQRTSPTRQGLGAELLCYFEICQYTFHGVCSLSLDFVNRDVQVPMTRRP